MAGSAEVALVLLEHNPHLLKNCSARVGDGALRVVCGIRLVEPVHEPAFVAVRKALVDVSLNLDQPGSILLGGSDILLLCLQELGLLDGPLLLLNLSRPLVEVALSVLEIGVQGLECLLSLENLSPGGIDILRVDALLHTDVSLAPFAISDLRVPGVSSVDSGVVS